MKLVIENLVKDFVGFRNTGEKFLSAASLGLYAGSRRFRALDDINITAGEDSSGEIIGVIGANGAGKSTLLNLLSGILKPTSGKIQFNGNVRSILELGVGFNGELTAAENIFYNGILWNYSREFIEKNIEALFEFAGLSDYKFHTLNTFSTGMQMRLAFSLATLGSADMLLVDEALAVGDASFQQKGVRRFQEFREKGSLVLVVSHDIHMLVSLCDRMILMDRGRVVLFDKPSRVAERYMDLIAESSRAESSQEYVIEKDSYSVSLLDSTGRNRSHFFTGEYAEFILSLHPAEKLEKVTVGIHVSDSRGIRVFGTNTRLLDFADLTFLETRDTKINFKLKLNLGPGKYSAGFSVHRGLSHGSDCYLWEEGMLDFEVERTAHEGFEGISFLEPEITIE